jgi:uncharacterized protein YkwD
MPATALEQLQLELINEARLNPLASAARYITSYSPLTSNQQNIQDNFNFWGVNGTALQNAFNALAPVQPLAWNESLGTAARNHSVAMGAANQQTHNSLPGEAAGGPGARMAANGYAPANTFAWGENIAAQGQDSLHILASLMVDWGPGGMQSPPGHRNNIMGIDDNDPNTPPVQSTFREIGIGIAQVATQSNVGPLAVTEDFGSRGTAGAFILGVAYTDTDNNKFYSLGEGVGGLVVSAVGGASTSSASTGGYSLLTTQIGSQNITFSGGGLSGSVGFATTLSNGQNVKIDIVNGTTLRTSVSGTISGPVTRIEGLGILGLTLTGDGGAQTIVGTRGNDTLDGQGGTDSALFRGTRAQYTLTDLNNGSVQVVGPDGTDTVHRVERLIFDDQTVNWSDPLFTASSFKLAAFGVGAGSWSSYDKYPRQVADVNGDGRGDIVGFGDVGVYVALGNADGSFQAPAFALSGFGAGVGGGSWTTANKYPRELGDVNGDGRADIVAFGETGVYVALGKTDGSFQAPAFALSGFGAGAGGGGWTSDDKYPRELADVNGDARADIVAFGETGVYVALGKTDGSFQAPAFALSGFGAGPGGGGWISADKYPRQVADVNDDGRADIVAFGETGVYVALGKTDGSFQAPTFELSAFGAGPGGGNWTSANTYPREVEDVNGDGSADIVAFGHAGVYVALADDFNFA